MSNTKLILISVMGVVSLQGCAAMVLGAAGTAALKANEPSTHLEWKLADGVSVEQAKADERECRLRTVRMSAGRYGNDREFALIRCMSAYGHNLIEVAGEDPNRSKKL